MFKKIIRAKRTIIWAAVSIVLIVVMIVAGVFANIYSAVIDMAFSGRRAVKIEGSDKGIYKPVSESEQDASDMAMAVTKKVAEEGTILLKNAEISGIPSLPLKKNAKVSVFGKNSVNLVYGGLGSGRGDRQFKRNTIFESLEAAGFTYNEILKSFYENDSLSGEARKDPSGSLDPGARGSGYTICETPQSKYTSDITSSYSEYNDAAIVVFSRTGSENYDLDMQGKDDGSRHYLSLNNDEKELLQSVRSKFSNVIVILNTLNIMETDFLEEYGVDSCLWIGGPGTTGIMALGEILNGTVTPSGRTTDTWAKDFTSDPTFNNFGDREAYTYKTGSGRKDPVLSYYFTDYDESIYVGYRYYETRAYDELLENETSTWYEDNVNYPFGYGLSYTEFEWTLTDDSELNNVTFDENKKISVKVKVKNVGDTYAGKDVVQLYCSAPYTAGEIEKAHKVLCGFIKTDELAPGEEKEYTVSFSLYDVASYDYRDANNNGHYGYELDGGEYTLYIGSSAHDEKFVIPFEIASGGIQFKNDPVTNNEVKNLYTDCENEYFDSDLMIKNSLMTRTNIDVQPAGHANDDRTLNKEISDTIEDTSTNNPNVNSYTMPKQGQNTSYSIYDLIQHDKETDTYFAPYEDSAVWESILNSLTVGEMAQLFNQGGFGSVELDKINKPATLESDGPVGWCNFVSITDTTWQHNNAYTSQVVMAATWNVDLIEEMGECVGEEGLWGSASNSDSPSYSGWYAPGVNIHRSPFCGRNFEYFSEDSFLTGMMAAAEIRGCQSKGVYCYVKHFALNEQETYRGGNCSWVTEQAMREIYLKPFELAVKAGESRAVMTSFNRIGTRWTGGDYRLVTEILRNEWGFKGTVISDYNEANPQINAKQMIYAGGDLNLATSEGNYWSSYDASNPADVTVLRMAAKNIIYTVANSNAVNASYNYKMAYWRMGFIVACAVISAGIVAWGTAAIITAAKKEK